MYYVNPDSESVVELGTKDYPYKDLGYVFVELLNFHSHSDRNLTIYVMEHTQNYLMVGQSAIVNITNVDILPYSSDESATPGMATIVGVDEGSIESTKGTSLNILQDYTLKLDDMIFDKSEINDTEKFEIAGSDYVILVHRSSLFVDNINFMSEFSSFSDSRIFIYAVYLQIKSLSLSLSSS